MIGLLGLCNSILEPVNHAEKLTDKNPKKKMPYIAPIRKVFSPEPDPYFSPLITEGDTLRHVIRSVKIVDGNRVKRCPKCKEWKGADTFYFRKETQQATGLSSYCKECKKEKQRK